MAGAVVQGRDRMAAGIEIVAVGGLKQVLLLAEDRPPQLPVALQQGRALAQQVEGEAIGAGGGERRKSSASIARPQRTDGVKEAGAELGLRPIEWLLGSMKNMAVDQRTAAGVWAGVWAGPTASSKSDRAEQAPHLAQPAAIASRRRSEACNRSATAE